MSQYGQWRREESDARKIYSDRTNAGILLAAKLQKEYGERPARDDTVVLAIPRGGVVTGNAIAERLGIDMDVLVSRKVGAPDNPELAIGAVMHDRSFFPNEDIIRILGVPEKYIQEQLKLQEKEIDRRLVRFRGSRVYQLEGKIVFLVDDGIATGATLFAAVSWLRKQRVKKLVVAVPVGPADTIARLEKLADGVTVLQAPFVFGSVGEFYSDFSQVSDDDVVRIMAKYRKI